MKPKQRVDLIVAIFLIILGIVLLIIPNYATLDLKYLFIFIMCFYTIANLIQYILTKKSKDIEGLLTSLGSFLIALISYGLDFTNSLTLALVLLSWIAVMSIAKLVKTDYYNDKRDRMYKLRIATLALFIIIGIITCLNLHRDSTMQVIILGYFFFIHGILELVDPITKSLLTR